MRADDLMENDDLGPGGDLGELTPPVGQHALIDQYGQANVALPQQNGQSLLGTIVQSGGNQERPTSPATSAVT